MRMNVLLWATVALASSCSMDNGSWQEEEPHVPATSLPDASASGDSIIKNGHFTAGSTVREVIHDVAFDDFGRLLFPVHRSVPEAMTLAQVSTSSVYIFYTNIKVEKTVEILNYLREESLAGRQIFYRFYSDEEIAANPVRANSGLFFFRGEADAPFAISICA